MKKIQTFFHRRKRTMAFFKSNIVTALEHIVTEIYMLYFSAIKGGYEKVETIGGLPLIPAVYSESFG